QWAQVDAANVEGHHPEPGGVTEGGEGRASRDQGRERPGSEGPVEEQEVVPRLGHDPRLGGSRPRPPAGHVHTTRKWATRPCAALVTMRVRHPSYAMPAAPPPGRPRRDPGRCLPAPPATRRRRPGSPPPGGRPL